MRTDPRIQQLASEAASKIKAISNERDAEIKQIYQEYQQQVEVIKSESYTDSFDQTPVQLSESHPHQIQSNSIGGSTIMAAADSIRLRKESKQCEVASRLAEFLEAHDPNHTYNFVMPDLLEFSCEVTLMRLRENADWQALEEEFKGVRGSIFEDWGFDDEPDESIPLPPRKDESTPKSKLTKLILATIAVSALAGSVAGWYFPWLNLPASNQSSTTKIQQVKE